MNADVVSEVSARWFGDKEVGAFTKPSVRELARAGNPLIDAHPIRPFTQIAADRCSAPQLQKYLPNQDQGATESPVNIKIRKMADNRIVLEFSRSIGALHLNQNQMALLCRHMGGRFVNGVN